MKTPFPTDCLWLMEGWGLEFQSDDDATIGSSRKANTHYHPPGESYDTLYAG